MLNFEDLPEALLRRRKQSKSQHTVPSKMLVPAASNEGEIEHNEEDANVDHELEDMAQVIETFQVVQSEGSLEGIGPNDAEVIEGFQFFQSEGSLEDNGP